MWLKFQSLCSDVTQGSIKLAFGSQLHSYRKFRVVAVIAVSLGLKMTKLSPNFGLICFVLSSFGYGAAFVSTMTGEEEFDVAKIFSENGSSASLF